MNLAFDAKGRLWVTSTVEYPYPAEGGDHAARQGHRPVRLRRRRPRTQGRDVRRRAQHPARRPAGRSGALVFAIDHIRKLTDTDGDGRADKEEKFLGTYGSRDTHGMTNHFTVGFDGWVYANHGFNNDSHVTAADGSSVKMNSGNNYRFKLDGSRVRCSPTGRSTRSASRSTRSATSTPPTATPARNTCSCAAPTTPASASPTTASASARR
jgi:hypothetical protein